MSSATNQGDAPDRPGSKAVTDEAILKVTKEIIIKFIECGRLSPANFDEMFEQVYKKVLSTVR
jgi:hypothetical protein